MKTTHLVSKGMHGSVELFGPTVEFLTSPSEADAVYCVMLGVVPPGVAIPLHSHPDEESFYMLSGEVQALSERPSGFDWLNVEEGAFLHVPSSAKHAFRNKSNEPAVQLITTTPKIGKFFQEIGRSASAGERLPPPTPEELQHFARTAESYGYWLGSPEQNEAIGIPSLGA